MIGIVNYNAGNITSVERALRFIGADFVTSNSPNTLNTCDKLIFPGVGDAKFAMNSLHNLGLDEFLRSYVNSNRKLLGICLGSQIIFDYSEEGDTKCLGLIPGTVKHLSALMSKNEGDVKPLKIPQIGWNDLTYCNGGPAITKNILEHNDYYFVHSYYIVPSDHSVVKAYCEYGGVVPAIIECGNIYATQFHPEKSGGCGLCLLSNFCL